MHEHWHSERNGDRRLFVLLAFAVPFGQLGQLLQNFRIKLGILERANPQFETDFASMNSYHSKVTSEVQRTLEVFEELGRRSENQP